MVILRRYSNRQLLADRLDPVLIFIRVNKRNHFSGRRSSSAWAKKAITLRNITLACLSSRFSRFSALSCSRSERLRPSGSPSFISACLNHLRNVSDVQAKLARNRSKRCPLRAVLIALLLKHTNSPLSVFRRISGSFFHKVYPLK